MMKSKLLLEAMHANGVPILRTNCGRWARMAAITLVICAAISPLALSDDRPNAEKPITDFYISPYGSDSNPGPKGSTVLEL
jgi:hypothetical protein